MATFLGFKQIKLSTWNGLEESAKTGYMWFVRDEITNDGDVFFGKKHYGHFSSAASAVDVVKLAEAVSGITAELGNLAFESGKTLADVISDIQSSLDDKLEASDIAGFASSADTVAALDKKVDAEEGKSLVDDDEIAKLAAIEANAQENVIEIVKVNGEALTVTDKAVDIILSGYTTSADTAAAIGAVDAKFADYATSADTAAAVSGLESSIDTAKNDAVASASSIASSEAASAEHRAIYSAYTLIEGMSVAPLSAVSATTVELESKVDTLIGDDEGKSARDIAVEEVAKIVASADTSFDTLKEIADWIKNDTTGAAAMANDIAALKVSAQTLDEKFEDYATSADTIAAIDAVYAKFADYATSADTDSAINAVDAKFADYATSADTASAIGAVDAKFADYATSADTAAAIKAAVDASVASAVTLEGGIATEIDGKEINVLVASGSVDVVATDKGKNFLVVNDENELEVNGVDTDAAVFSKDITIAGGPLAEIAKKAYTDGKVPSGTTLQDFFMNLLCVEIWGAAKGPTYTFSASVTKPTVQLTNNGKSVPVGTKVTASASAQATSGALSAKVTGMTYGYSLDGAEIASTATSYTQSVSVAKSGTAALACTWSGLEEVDDTVDGSTGASKEFYVSYGANSYNVSETGLTCTPAEFSAVTVYAVSNLNHVSGGCATISQEGYEASSAYAASKTPTNSAAGTVTGYYPIYFGQIETTDATADDLTEEVIKGHSSSSSVPTSVDIVKNTACFYVAVPSDNANYSKTSMIVKNSTTKATFGMSQSAEKILAMLNNVANIDYKVFFIANGGGWPEDSTTFDTISFE